MRIVCGGSGRGWEVDGSGTDLPDFLSEVVVESVNNK